jgi:ribosomal protein L11
MNIEDLTLKQLREIAALVGNPAAQTKTHPFIGQKVLCRCDSAGVHVGTLVNASGTEAQLTDAIRIWKWQDGGLSLSAIANVGQKNGRNDFTGQVALTEVIEIIPVTADAWGTYAKFIEK